MSTTPPCIVGVDVRHAIKAAIAAGYPSMNSWWSLIGMKALIPDTNAHRRIVGLAKREGMKTLLQDGIEKVLQGLTTYKQVRAVAIK